MKILLDECLPRQLRHDLPDHDVTTVAAMGWAGTKNGALLRLAASDFDVFITIDRNIAYQQRLQMPNMAVILLVAPNIGLRRCGCSLRLSAQHCKQSATETLCASAFN